MGIAAGVVVSKTDFEIFRDNKMSMRRACQRGWNFGLSRHQVEVLRKCRKENALMDLMAVSGRSDRTKRRDQVLKPLLDGGFIEITIPDKPTSRLQKYRLTDKGRDWLAGGKS